MVAITNKSHPVMWGLELMLSERFEEGPQVDWPPGKLHEMVLNGTYQFTLVGKDDPQYAVWFYVTADAMLHSTAMLSLSRANKLREMFDCLDELAKGLGCRGVVFETRWKGMIRQSARQGYAQTAVVMKKEF